MQKLLKLIVLAAGLVVMFQTAVFAGFLGIVRVYADQADVLGSNQILLVVDNILLTDLESPPVIYNDYTLVPARDVFESLGANVGWIPPTQEIIVSYEDSIVAMQIDSRFANVRGSLVEMSIPPRIINGRTMIPMRFVSESFGFDVQWDPQQREARVARKGDLLHSGINIPPSLLPGYDQIQDNREDDGRYRQYLEPEENAVDTVPRDISPFAIPSESHPRVNLVSVNEASADVFIDMITYGVTADGPISRVDTLFLEGNRVVLDIHNAANSLPSITQMSSRFIRQVRAASEQAGVTRVVFDLHAPFDVGVTISGDRRSVYLSFEQVNVTDIRIVSDESSDTVTIDFNGAPNHTTSFLSAVGKRSFAIDLLGSSMTKKLDDAQTGRFVSHMHSSQHSAVSSRVVLTLREEASVTTDIVGNSLIVTVTTPTYRNISYDAASRTIIISKVGMGINAGAITHNDEYHNLRYILNMGYNLRDHLGYGEFPINHGAVESVSIQTNEAGETSLIISTHSILAFVVDEDNENIYIRARLPREVYSHIVVIDPGHGGHDNGASYSGILEKDLNLQISEKVAAIIRQSGHVKVYTTRNDDTFVSLADRASFANELGDLFVSIHNNAVDVRRGGNPATNGTETFYWTRPNADPDSINSRDAAEIFQRNIVGAIGSTDRGVRSSQFVVLSQTTIPAVFLEIGFMSNPDELQRLADPEHQQIVAEAIYASIREVFSVYTPRR